MRPSIYALIALSAVAICVAQCTPASAELPEALPGKSKFTGKTGKVTFQVKGGASVICKSSTGSGEITTTKSGTGTIDFEGCTTVGLQIHSLGDEGSVILAKGEAVLCYLNKASHIVGLVVRLPVGGVHVEVPATKLLLVKTGAFIFAVSPVNSKQTTFKEEAKQKEGKQEFEKCEGGAKEVLFLSTDAGEPVQTGVEGSGEVTFESAQELMA
jgi:hypothetical protein